MAADTGAGAAASPQAQPATQPMGGQSVRIAAATTTAVASPGGTNAAIQSTIPALGLASAAKPMACANPNAMGVVRTVEIDTSGGPGFGSQHFKTYDFLQDHEVAPTFDDGPWHGHTPAVLKAFADQCFRATFSRSESTPPIIPTFSAKWSPPAIRSAHTWLACRPACDHQEGGPDAAREEIEKGMSAVHMMAGAPIAPFFRFPDLRHPPEMLTYLGERNVASFSTDIDSWDFKIEARPTDQIPGGQGHQGRQGHHPDARLPEVHFDRVAANTRPATEERLQGRSHGPEGTLNTLPQYDEAVLKENKLPTLASNKWPRTSFAPSVETPAHSRKERTSEGVATCFATRPDYRKVRM